MPAASGPASQPALAVLCSWLDGFDDRAQSRGRAYFKAGRVRGLGMDGNRISAVVEGSDYYTTALLWDQTTWTSTCSCPVAENCKHAHATGLAWVRKFDRSSALPPLHSAPFAALAAIPGVTTGAALPAALPRPHLLSFREQWTPLLAEKLGRPLAADEADALDRLLALFRSMSATYGRLSIYQMQQHGFAYSARAVGGSYGQLFEGWWDAHRPPADPWALWQYIAYDWERDGRPIPAVFRPMTDTAKVAAALEDWLLRSDLAEWRHALAAGTNPGREPTAATEAAKISDLRLRLGPKGGFFLEARTGPDKPWKFPAAKWLNSLATAGPADFVHLPPAAAALAIALAAECDGRTREIAAKFPLPERIAGRVLAYAAAHPAILLADGSPWRVEPGRLSLA
ncbi:MAG: hypothetical protein HY302_01710, partial [Opitutae bacterium]|nr:hypothetical protein [Opitutae bacterium]